MKHFFNFIFATFLIVLPMASIAGNASSKELKNTNGKALLQKYCSNCHGISIKDKSLHPEAPEFRSLSQNYPVELLAEALAEGIMSGHPDMPIFEFSAKQVEQIINYLESIQAQ